MTKRVAFATYTRSFPYTLDFLKSARLAACARRGLSEFLFGLVCRSLRLQNRRRLSHITFQMPMGMEMLKQEALPLIF